MGKAIIIVGTKDLAMETAIHAKNRGYSAFIMEPDDSRIAMENIPVYYVDPVKVELHDGPMNPPAKNKK